MVKIQLDLKTSAESPAELAGKSSTQINRCAFDDGYSEKDGNAEYFTGSSSSRLEISFV